jgi:hypothetical protein
MTLSIDLELPSDLARLELPVALQRRLQDLLDRQDGGMPLTEAEKSEAEGLVDLSDLLSLLRQRASKARQ